jgi:hypothetical protein
MRCGSWRSVDSEKCGELADLLGLVGRLRWFVVGKGGEECSRIEK